LAAPLRLAVVDAIRGLAIAGVVLFHLVWDLEFTGFISGVANHPLWLGFGRALAGSFMLLVGVSLVLSALASLRAGPYLRRLGKIVAAAAAITVVTFYIMPDRFIYFGILHAIVAATLVGTLFLRAPAWVCLLVGLAVFLAPIMWQSEVFDTRWLAWIGFAERVPLSNDFVPIFPWVGLTLLGMAGTKFLLCLDLTALLGRWAPEGWLGHSVVWMGRRSLMIYLVHQPVLLSVILPLSRALSAP